MDIQEAIDKFNAGDRSEKVLNTILQDAYQFLESENFHAAIGVIEILTSIEYI